MSNTIKSVSLVSPFRTVDAGACFTIDTPKTPFLLQGVCKVAGEYVFSGWIKADKTATIEMGTVKAEIETSWTRVVIPLLKSASDTEDVAIYFNTATKYYMYHAQLEMGNKATKWQPAPGDVTESIQNTADTIEAVRKSIDPAIQKATEFITGNRGGYVVFHRSVDASGAESEYPDEILIMDSPYITAAKNVWRWNKSGLGHSSNGINGPYELAILADGTINASFIKTGTMSADNIQGGSLTSSNIYSTQTRTGYPSHLNKMMQATLYGSNFEIWNVPEFTKRPEQSSSAHSIAAIYSSVDGEGFIRLSDGKNTTSLDQATNKYDVKPTGNTLLTSPTTISFVTSGNSSGVLSNLLRTDGTCGIMLAPDKGDVLVIGTMESRTIADSGYIQNVNVYGNIEIGPEDRTMHIYDTIKYGTATLNGTWTYKSSGGTSINYIAWK